eukprot:Rmarinus@m.26171
MRASRTKTSLARRVMHLPRSHWTTRAKCLLSTQCKKKPSIPSLGRVASDSTPLSPKRSGSASSLSELTLGKTTGEKNKPYGLKAATAIRRIVSHAHAIRVSSDKKRDPNATQSLKYLTEKAPSLSHFLLALRRHGLNLLHALCAAGNPKATVMALSILTVCMDDSALRGRILADFQPDRFLKTCVSPSLPPEVVCRALGLLSQLLLSESAANAVSVSPSRWTLYTLVCAECNRVRLSALRAVVRLSLHVAGKEHLVKDGMVPILAEIGKESETGRGKPGAVPLDPGTHGPPENGSNTRFSEAGIVTGPGAGAGAEEMECPRLALITLTNIAVLYPGSSAMVSIGFLKHLLFVSSDKTHPLRRFAFRAATNVARTHPHAVLATPVMVSTCVEALTGAPGPFAKDIQLDAMRALCYLSLSPVGTKQILARKVTKQFVFALRSSNVTYSCSVALMLVNMTNPRPRRLTASCSVQQLPLLSDVETRKQAIDVCRRLMDIHGLLFLSEAAMTPNAPFLLAMACATVFNHVCEDPKLCQSLAESNHMRSLLDLLRLRSSLYILVPSSEPFSYTYVPSGQSSLPQHQTHMEGTRSGPHVPPGSPRGRSGSLPDDKRTKATSTAGHSLVATAVAGAAAAASGSPDMRKWSSPSSSGSPSVRLSPNGPSNDTSPVSTNPLFARPDFGSPGGVAKSPVGSDQSSPTSPLKRTASWVTRAAVGGSGTKSVQMKKQQEETLRLWEVSIQCLSKLCAFPSARAEITKPAIWDALMLWLTECVAGMAAGLDPASPHKSEAISSPEEQFACLLEENPYCARRAQNVVHGLLKLVPIASKDQNGSMAELSLPTSTLLSLLRFSDPTIVVPGLQSLLLISETEGGRLLSKTGLRAFDAIFECLESHMPKLSAQPASRSSNRSPSHTLHGSDAVDPKGPEAGVDELPTIVADELPKKGDGCQEGEPLRGDHVARLRRDTGASASGLSVLSDLENLDNLELSYDDDDDDDCGGAGVDSYRTRRAANDKLVTSGGERPRRGSAESVSGESYVLDMADDASDSCTEVDTVIASESQ